MRVCRWGYNETATGRRRDDFPNNTSDDIARAAVDGWSEVLGTRRLRERRDARIRRAQQIRANVTAPSQTLLRLI
jgi:hypothetical protein